MTKDEIKQAVARGWAAPGQTHKTVDPSLANAIAEAVHAADVHPNLGLATTMQLIDELHARAEVADTGEDAWPRYRTCRA